MQVVEYVEEDGLGTGFSGEFLYVVDNECVDHLVEVDEVGHRSIPDGILVLRHELVHGDVQDLLFGVALADLMAYGLDDMGFAETRVSVYVQRVEWGVSGIYCHGHSRRAGQTVAFALDECIEGVIRAQLRIDNQLFESGNYEWILYICGIGLGLELRDSGRYGILRGRHAVLGPWDCIPYAGLFTEQACDDRLYERDVVILDLIDITCIRNTQA